MKKFFAEFKAFIKKGNIVDLAVAVIIGAAFNKIVSSLVNDIIMPLVSLCVGGADVTDWKWVIRAAEYDANGAVVVAETALKYGVFIQAIIDFLIIALTVFIIVKLVKTSSQKIGEISKTIISETKELTKKQIKALKKLQKKANKKGQTIEQVAADKGVDITELQPVVEKIEAAEAQAKKTDSVEATTVIEEVDTNAEILTVLKEIRDSLGKPKKKDNSTKSK